MSAYCRRYEKEMRDVAEHEQQQCEENGQDCSECPDLVDETGEAYSNRMTLYFEQFLLSRKEVEAIYRGKIVDNEIFADE